MSAKKFLPLLCRAGVAAAVVWIQSDRLLLSEEAVTMTSSAVNSSAVELIRLRPGGVSRRGEAVAFLKLGPSTAVGSGGGVAILCWPPPPSSPRGVTILE